MKDILERYAALKAAEKTLKTELAELNPQIKSFIIEQGADKLDSEYGTFSLKKVPQWQFSEVVQNLEDALEKEKEKEKATGTATRADDRIDLMFK